MCSMFASDHFFLIYGESLIRQVGIMRTHVSSLVPCKIKQSVTYDHYRLDDPSSSIRCSQYINKPQSLTLATLLMATPAYCRL